MAARNTWFFRRQHVYVQVKKRIEKGMDKEAAIEAVEKMREDLRRKGKSQKKITMNAFCEHLSKQDETD